MKSKIILIFILVILILIVAVFQLVNGPKQESTDPLAGQQELFVPTRPVITPQVPNGETISIDSVNVSNFYNFGSDITSEGDVVISEKPGYTIEYLNLFKTFLIVLNNISSSTQQAAQEDFLTSLKINQNQACQLKVDLTYAPDVPSTDGKVFPLSFCK